MSATLGKQALHQGLIAGAAGLLIVIIFLIAYYRVLGVIATVGLLVYGLYFYALIKLIPITLTLPGIAGLILTIGVAADANIVIFERVKEEIRAGRSIRQGIVTGYKKGLTAIIDANVVTIMTAFILFVLATADVKGFAFTLGIGTAVSLFTAVLATQAILMTMGSSRMISRPSALGAAGNRRRWRFDFMGASKYFFSMSGVILLIGALAIGGRGLNLGIDFTSGTRVAVGLEPAPRVENADSFDRGSGRRDQTRWSRRCRRPSLGRNGFQISAKQIRSPPSPASAALLQEKGFGIVSSGKDFNSTFVGPTFGKTIANSAVIAIIASLLVISAYVALRFEWKSAVPVLIALMHDLLITAGVYSLTGREVTTATVAALLTILGYSLVRHDHRVRPGSGERPADAAGRVLADRQSLDERGADPVAGDDLVHADADPRAAAVRRCDAEGLRVRAADRRRLRRVLVDLHRLAGANALEGARAPLPLPPRADRGRDSDTSPPTPTRPPTSSPSPSACVAPAGLRPPSPTPSQRPSSSR